MKAKVTQKLIAELNEDELAVRLIEAGGQCRRIAGVSPSDMLNHQTPADVAASARGMARTAILYVAESLGAAVRPN